MVTSLRPAKCTPVVRSAALSAWIGAEVALKLENLQVGGSFKWRGVRPRVDALSKEERSRGLACVSGGNFGRALALACRDVEAKLDVFVPSSARPGAIDAIRSLGAAVHVLDTVLEAFEAAQAHVRCSGALMIDDLDDPVIAAGYGTLLSELLEQAPVTRRLIVAAGGGLLAAGLCRAMKPSATPLDLELAEPLGAPTVHAALAHGRAVTVDVRTEIATLGVPRIGDGVLQTLMDSQVRSTLVSDGEAAEACSAALSCAGLSIDLAAGCSVALARRLAMAGDPLVDTCVLICGGSS